MCTKQTLYGLYSFLGAVIFSGCLALKTEPIRVDESGIELNFSATNTNDTTVRLTWDPYVGSAALVTYRVYRVAPGNSLIPVSNDLQNTTLYSLSGLVPGSLYAFRLGVVKGNEVTLYEPTAYAFTFGGLISVAAQGPGTGPGKVSVTVAPPGAADEINIYCKLGTRHFRLKTLTPGEASVPNTSIPALDGAPCEFYARAKFLQVYEDGNQKLVSLPNGGRVPSILEAAYKGILTVQAVGPAPAAPALPAYVPQADLTKPSVQLSWAPFVDPVGSTTFTEIKNDPAKDGQYVVLRTAQATAFNTTSLPPACTAASNSVCTVCTVPANATAPLLNCVDNNAASYAVGNAVKYDYLVTVRQDYFDLFEIVGGFDQPINDWVAPDPVFPLDAERSHRITVAIPPDNMVLVNRESSNREMCDLLNKPIEPGYKNRCIYAGQGAGSLDYPVNSGYFDLGYSFFMDRFEVGVQVNTGGACPGGICVVQSTGSLPAPSAALVNAIALVANYSNAGRAATVFQCSPSGGSCAWGPVYKPVGAAILARATNNPTAQSPSPVYPWTMTGEGAVNICNARVIDGYGNMRPLRSKEHTVAAAWPRLVGEPGALTDVQQETLEGGLADGTCNTRFASGTSGRVFAAGELVDTVADPNNRVGTVKIGSTSTRNCVSKFGAQDLIGNAAEAAVDTVSCFQGSNGTSECIGTVSQLDPDLDDLNGIAFNGIDTIGPQATTGAPPATCGGQLCDYKTPTDIWLGDFGSRFYWAKYSGGSWQFSTSPATLLTGYNYFNPVLRLVDYSDNLGGSVIRNDIISKLNRDAISFRSLDHTINGQVHRSPYVGAHWGTDFGGSLAGQAGRFSAYWRDLAYPEQRSNPRCVVPFQ